MSNVFFKKITYAELLKNPQVIVEAIKRANFVNLFKKNEFIGIKIHFGEKGNKSYINPLFLTDLIRFLKNTQARIFFLETNTLYRGQRSNAIDHINLALGHGFGKLNIPIIIGDGVRGNDYIEIEINKKHFNKCFIASALKDLNFLLVLSHFTGHMLTGFGATIKNLGMGCASRKGKLAQHCEINPTISLEKCFGCGNCAKNCPAMAIEEKNNVYFIIEKKCIGCAQCITLCPNGAIKINWSENYSSIGEKIVEYAYAVVKYRPCAFINFCLFITKECDCMNKEETPIVKDLGILFSNDPVAIDKASLDLINNNEGRDVLKEFHPQIDYLHHLKYAESIGLGSLDYKIIEI